MINCHQRSQFNEGKGSTVPLSKWVEGGEEHISEAKVDNSAPEQSHALTFSSSRKSLVKINSHKQPKPV